MTFPMAEAFRAWALDPARTNDELYTTELLIDWGRVVWGWKHESPKTTDWEARRKHQEERTLNPAYRPVLDSESLEATVEVWDGVLDFSPHLWEDRPIRDLSVLRFFPHLTKLELNQCEADDLSPIRAMRQLQHFRMAEPSQGNGHLVEDLRDLTGLPVLESVNLILYTPWIDLGFLVTLPKLQTLICRTNLLNLAGLAALPLVQTCELHSDFQYRTPLRSAADLPEMPLVRFLKIESIASLAGLERYPEVCNLELTGSFTDLTPLQNLAHLTFLKLSGERFSDLTPLALPPQLHQIVLTRERPLDIEPLADAPALRELKADLCPALQTELAALNAGLLPWSGDFLLHTPRPLATARLVSFDRKDPVFEAAFKDRRAAANERERAQAKNRDLAMKAAHDRWFTEELQTRLETLLGIGWGITRGTYINLRRHRDVMRLPEIVAMLRAFSASSPEPVQFALLVDSDEDLSADQAEIQKRLQRGRPAQEEQFDAEQELEEWEDYQDRRQKHRDFLEREYRFKLLQQQGATIDPAAFSPHADQSGSPPAEAAEPYRDSYADGAPAEEAENEPGFPEHATNPLVTFILQVDEQDLLIEKTDALDAAILLNEELIPWQDLPEPIPQRPLWMA